MGLDVTYLSNNFTTVPVCVKYFTRMYFSIINIVMKINHHLTREFLTMRTYLPKHKNRRVGMIENTVN